MNTDNGNIEFMNEILGHQSDRATLAENIKEIESMGYVQVNEDDMTIKQKRERKVSTHDHRSILGKELTKAQQRKKVFGR